MNSFLSQEPPWTNFYLFLKCKAKKAKTPSPFENVNIVAYRAHLMVTTSLWWDISILKIIHIKAFIKTLNCIKPYSYSKSIQRRGCVNLIKSLLQEWHSYSRCVTNQILFYKFDMVKITFTFRDMRITVTPRTFLLILAIPCFKKACKACGIILPYH